MAYAGQQSRGHLHKECTAWGKEILRLWIEAGEVLGRKDRDPRGEMEWKSRKGFGRHKDRPGRAPAALW